MPLKGAKLQEKFIFYRNSVTFGLHYTQANKLEHNHYSYNLKGHTLFQVCIPQGRGGQTTHIHTQTGIATYRLNRPRGQFSANVRGQK